MKRPVKRKGIRLLSLMLILSMCCVSFLYAQTGVLKGIVAEVNGEAIIGANVMVKGTSNGTITDFDGGYTLSNVKANDVIVFSYIGFTNQEIRYTGQTTLNVKMEESVEALDEVVVVGYGSLSKREVSSSIVQVNKEDFLQGAVNNPMEMLQGKVAGFTVNQTSPANPNSSGTQLQIRGAASLSASNSPLVIVDGVIGADYQGISPQDIESMTVLKDAGSAAIYGTRGANGVVLVTTKRGSGKEGTARITYDSWIGLNSFKEKPRVLTPEEFREKGRDADYGSSTNWWDLMLREGPSYDINQYLSVDGTLRNGFYGMSLNYRKATGADYITTREEYGGKLQVQQRALNNLLELNGSLNYRKTVQRNGSASWGNALTTNPTMPVWDDETGNYYQPTTPTGASQPVGRLAQTDAREDGNYVLAYGEAKVNILKQAHQALNTSLSYSINHRTSDTYNYQPSTSSDSFWNGYTGNAQRGYTKTGTNRLEFLVNYNLSLSDHDFKVVGGYNYEEYNRETLNGQNYNFAFDQLKWNDLGSGTYLGDGKAKLSSSKSKSKLIGLFGRINYNWKGLVMASASYRREGSTKFGENNKWGDFYAGSLALELANFAFMKDYTFINSLKPRFSYGVTGRSDFDSYLSLQTYQSRGQYYMDGKWVVGFAPSVNANSLLAWEKAIVTNIGIDFSLFKRIRGSFEWFERKSQDLLYNYTAPQPPFLYSSIMVNVGTIRNRGIEFTLDADILTKTPVKWTSGIVAGTGSTQLTKLSNDVFKSSYLSLGSTGGTGSTDYHFRVQEGGKIGQFWALEWTGDIDELGNMYVYNADGEPILMSKAKSSDKRLLDANGVPKLDLSWNNTLKYKNFDLNIFWRGAFGFQIYNNMVSSIGLEGGGNANLLLSAYDTKLKYAGGITSSYFLEDGDYVKLENITLGYNFKPKTNNYLDNLRVYVSAKNIATITGYTGNNPSIVRVTGLTPGIDGSGAYPQALAFTLGVTMRLK